MALTTTDSRHVAVFDTVSDHPLDTPIFDSEDLAGAFIIWAEAKHSLALRSRTSAELDSIRTQFMDYVIDEASGEIDPDVIDNILAGRDV